MICPKCGAEIVTGAMTCVSCGYRLPQVQNMQSDDRQSTQPQMSAPPKHQTGNIPPVRPLSSTGNIKRQPTGPIPSVKSAQTGPIPQVALLSQTGEMQRIAARNDARQKAKQSFVAEAKSVIRNKKLMLGIGAALLLLVTVILIIAVPKDKQGYTPAVSTIRWYYKDATNETYIAADGKIASYTFSGQFGGYSVSLDGTVRTAKSDSGALYMISAKKTVKIAAFADSYTMSQSGNSVAYTDEEGRLVLYSSGAATVVSEEKIFDYKLSPDGKVMVYAYEDGENDLVLCKYENGRSVHIGDGVMPVSVSDDGRYIYAYNTGGALYCYADEWRKKISTEVMPYFFTNTDGSELGFFTSSSVAYVSLEGGDAHKLFTSGIEHNGYVYPVTDAHFDASWRTVANAYTTCVETGMKSFALSYLSQAGSIYYIDENYNGIPAAADAKTGSERTALIYGDKIVYLNASGELYRLDMNSASSGKLISEDVIAYSSTPDGAYVYFIDSQNDVWVYDGKKSKKIAEGGSALYAAKSGVMLMLTDFDYETGGTLCYSEKGGNKHSISDGVMTVSVGAKSVEYTKSEDGAYKVYSSPSGKKFELIFENR